VQLIRWQTDSDQFTPGQWLKGRIYERRCDLSPSGTLFCYFAAKWKGPIDTWTAISKPPFFTALALWPKGDAWGGGGLFGSDDLVLLNHPNNQWTLADGFQLRTGMKVKPLHERAGGGEDYPIFHMRLLRNGWQLLQDGQYQRRGRKSKIWGTFDPPQIYAKPFSLADKCSYSLRMLTHGLHETDGPWYVVEFDVVDLRSKVLIALGRADWAEWDGNGDLLFAKDGKLFRLRRTDAEPYLPAIEAATELLDLTNSRFEEKAPEEWAAKW